MQVLRSAAPLFATATPGTVQMSIEAIVSNMDLRMGFGLLIAVTASPRVFAF
jgi:hypothetical protein